MNIRKLFEPYVDPVDGTVGSTPLLKNLYLKKGAKVILIQNLDVCDGLANGAKGTVLDFVKSDGVVTQVIVEFENKEAGKMARENHVQRKIMHSET